MAIKLTEEAFSLLHGLKERLELVNDWMDMETDKAREELLLCIADLEDWIGPGAP